MECFHWLKKKTKGKKAMMALKLDMAKAYDKMEWGFIEKALLATGFPQQFTSTIMKCISTVSYQFLINGQPRNIISKRGIRQDDSLLFSRANQKEADTIKHVLHSYQIASGQTVSLEKSEVSYSRNMSEIEKNMICDRIDVKVVTSHSTYLGLPVIFGRSKKEIFSFVKDRVWKKIKGWKEKCLSRAGKETLIKAVAQAIPTYTMSCYKFPVWCCDDIEAMLAKF
ncbi:uncharacterized protein [Medicago truncatula]|uniref:uncharacterized protein isoform X2 n=1 Tax=Medicago truncatula TaxID=3880 RepID=UPI000D2F1690|nr:uncharacterized protein LOC112422521 isoform X2 [Medicago truncatula]